MHAIIISHASIKSINRVPYRLLARLGCEVTVVVPDRWKSGLGDLRAEPEPVDTKVALRVRKRGGLSHSNAYWLSGSLSEVIRSGSRPAAIYVDEDPAGIVAAQAARAARAQGAGLVVLGVQNLLKRYPPPFRALQRYVFRNAAGSVSVSEQAAQTLRARGYAGPSRIVGFGTDMQPLTQEQREATRERFGFGRPLAGYVGRLVPEKGVDVFIEALARQPGIHGVIAGSGPEREALEKRAAELRLNERLTFTGVLSPDDVALVIGTLDALVLPSRTASNWSEQFGRVLIEAMASDVAVVASDSGAIGEVVGDAGILVPEDDAAALADAMSRALEPAVNERIRTLGIARVREHYTNKVLAQTLFDALQAAATRGIAS